MTNANFTALLRHESLPQPLATALQTEALNGIGKDAKLLLAAAVEGLLISTSAPGLHRLLVLDPLTSARLLAKDPLIGHRLWTAAQIATAVTVIDRTTDLAKLLDYWCRARLTYRNLEKKAAAAKVHFADGTPFNLTTLKVA